MDCNTFTPDYDGRKHHDEDSYYKVKGKGVAITVIPGHARGDHGYTGHAQITDGVFDIHPVIFWRLPSNGPNIPSKPIAEEPSHHRGMEYDSEFRRDF